MNTNENICAMASGVGGAVAIIRISGDGALDAGNSVWRGKSPLCRENARKMLLGKAGLEPVLAVFFAAPASYTGEDVVELHVHGGMRSARAVLAGCIAAGCRMAEPGEFTFRAFINRKMDLAQAEAVGDLIDARSDKARHLAERQLAGSLSRRLRQLREDLVFCISECEAQLDFSEDLGVYDSSVLTRLDAVRAEVAGLIAGADCGGILRNGVNLVIAGRPNAGKSSLLNRLLGYDRAIVTEEAGTTRDTIEEHIELRGIPVNLTDTAGLRSGGGRIEAMGIERSRAALERADVIFYLLDASDAKAELDYFVDLDLPGDKVIAIFNKCDLSGAASAVDSRGILYISALTGEGMDALLDRFAAMVWRSGEEDPEVAVSFRHRELLEKASSALENAATELESGRCETAASSLRAAVSALGSITGETVEPDILGNIFSRFCIGK